MIWDAFLKAVGQLAEQLIRLIGQRSAHKRSAFDEYIEPMFARLTRIHEDYRVAIASIAETVSDPNVPSSEIQLGVRDRQATMAHVRQLLYELNTVLMNSWYCKVPRSKGKHASVREAVFEFGCTLHDYFRSSVGDATPTGRGQTWFCGLLDLVDAFHRGDMEREDLLDDILGAADELTLRWKAVAAAYARLKGKIVVDRRFV